MLNRTHLYPYQTRVVEHIREHPNAMVWADMGLGKSISALTAFVELQDRCDVPAMIVFAPLRVCQSVWRQEAAKWEHTKHLTFSPVHGDEAARVVALRRRADVYLINYDLLQWFAAAVQHHWLRHGKYPPFQMAVFDEVTKLKNTRSPSSRGGSKRGKALTRILPYFRRRVGLTGEPAANGYKDLFGQYLCVDGGARLGTSITGYRDAFLVATGFEGRSWISTRSGQEQIHARISDITLELSASEHLDLPPVTENIVWVDLPPKARDIYDTLEKQFFAELDSGAQLETLNEASKLNKLAQIAGGAAYLSVGGPWEEVHRAKMDALQDLVEEAGGRPMLLGYSYRHEAARIAQAFPERPLRREGAAFLSSKLNEHTLNDTIRRWERDEIPLLCGHPASMGHGLNLQGSSARSVVWFGLPWSLELYRQLTARLFGGHRRQGASVVHHILARGTVDELKVDLLQTKEATQQVLKKAVNAYRASRNLS